MGVLGGFSPLTSFTIATETFISKTLSLTSNITIDYTVNVPYKKGVEDKALLPIRIFYWFTDTDGTCYFNKLFAISLGLLFVVSTIKSLCPASSASFKHTSNISASRFSLTFSFE